MTNPVNIRELVLGILIEVNSSEAHSHLIIRDVLSKYQYLSKQERAFLTRVTEGTLERMILIDDIIDQFSKVKVTKMKPVIRNLLRSAVYQLMWMDSIPDSAVCNEAVKLAKKKGFGTLSGFVNGVLRNIARNRDQIRYPDESTEPIRYLCVCYSQPEWLVRRWLESYGYDTVKRILEGFLTERGTCIRVHTGKITPQDLTERLTRQKIRVLSSPYLPEALELSGYDHLEAIPEFQQGLFQVQDVSSMLAARAADPKEGDRIIDVCAAPGGKSLYLAERLNGTGHVEARDLTEAKVSLIRENIQKSGCTNIEARVMDACVTDEESIGQADIVIADLPCSGLGVLGKKPEIKYRMTPEQIDELARLQKQILDTVHKYVKPGGILLYSTCTIDRQENEEIARWFAAHYPFTPVHVADVLGEEMAKWESEEGYLQLLPGIHRCDGFFLAKFRRTVPEEQE